MRKIVIIAGIVCLLAPLAQAEEYGFRGPADYFGQLPSPPGTGCSITAETRQNFEKNVRAVKKEIDKEVQFRRRAIKKAQSASSKKMMENAVDLPGFQGKSQDEMKKMSKAEKRKMAEKMMQEKYGVSMGDLKKQKDAGAMANVDFAKTMAGEQQANELMKSKSEVEAGKKKIKDNVKLTKEQEDLTRRTVGLRTNMQSRIGELETSPQAVALKKAWEDEKKKLDKMASEYATCQKLDAQEQVIQQARSTYCSYMATNFLEALSNYSASIQSSFSNHRRLDEVVGEIQKNQVGIGLPNEAIGLNGLETVQDYTRYLIEAYQYNDKDPDAPPRSHCDGAAGN